MNDTKAVKVKEIMPIVGEAEKLIAMAIDKGLDVDKLERLVAMRREMKTEWAKEEYTKAKAAFQANCPTIQKTKIVYDKNGQTIRYKYAPIESIVEQVKSLLAENGFSYSIGVKQEDALLIVSCNVTHKAGHTESYSIPVPIGSEAYMSEVQKYGARITFAKRYAFMDAFGILTGDEDTDATDRPLTAREMAEKKEIDNTPKHLEKPTVAVSMPSQDIQKITADQKLQILTLLGKNGKTTKYISRFLEALKVVTYQDLSQKNAENLIIALEKQFKNPPVNLG